MGGVLTRAYFWGYGLYWVHMYNQARAYFQGGKHGTEFCGAGLEKTVALHFKIIFKTLGFYFDYYLYGWSVTVIMSGCRLAAVLVTMQQRFTHSFF